MAGARAAPRWGLALDPTGNVIVTGGLHGSIDFGGGPVSSAASSGNSDIYLAKLLIP